MENNLFCDAQHGFFPGRSCMTQLLTVIEMWTASLDRGKPVDAIYLDFKKAFDTVPHQRLLMKLDAYGISGTMRKWIEEFLMDRRQKVVVNGQSSEWSAVKSGIPQGSVLGPTLFVLFINDLPDVVGSTAKIFADDTKVYRDILSVDDRNVLQQDLNSLVEWSKKWLLFFNTDKCKVLHLGFNNPQHQYTLDGAPLAEVKEEKDLGVVIDSELKFHSHVSQAVKKASRMLALIRRAFSCHDEDTIPHLFKGLVRPLLEYGNLIWHPQFMMDVKEVEKVQRRVTKMVPIYKDLPYEERLKVLKMPSLQYRRKRGDMIQVFKIVRRIDRLDPADFFEFPPYPATRGHRAKIYKQRCRLKVRENAFSQRVVNDWNSLSDEIVSAETVNQFKARLDRYWVGERYKTPY